MRRLGDWLSAPFRFIAWVVALVKLYLFKDGIDE